MMEEKLNMSSSSSSCSSLLLFVMCVLDVVRELEEGLSHVKLFRESEEMMSLENPKEGGVYENWLS